MKQLFVIPCTFQLVESGEVYRGLAICTDPDTPQTFVYDTGLPYSGTEIWTYKLNHFRPWAAIEVEA